MSETTPHYYAYSAYLKKQFGEGRTHKVVVSSGLTCPTRDGTIDKGGCTFCDVRGSSSYFGKIGRGDTIKEQIRSRIPGIKNRYDAKHFIAYFQSYTNTYSDVNYLREIYEAALSEPEISGLAIGTRPDCLPDAVIDLLEELAQKHYVSLELGIQSFEDDTLKWLIRGHDGDCSRVALKKLKERAPHVQVCAHLIFGSPTDSLEMAKNAALELNRSGVAGVKLHQLMILKNTKLAKMYEAEPFKTLSIPEYAKLVSEFLEHLDPSIYVERLYAKATHPDECIAPEWSKTQWGPHNRFNEYFAEHQVKQGSFVSQL